MIYCRFSVRALQPLRDRWKFQDNSASTAGSCQVLTPKFRTSDSNPVSALCEGWLQCIASVMQGLLTLHNHCCNNWLFYFARLCDFTIDFFPIATILADCCYIIIAAVPDLSRRPWGQNLEIPFCAQGTKRMGPIRAVTPKHPQPPDQVHQNRCSCKELRPFQCKTTNYHSACSGPLMASVQSKLT